MTKVFKITAGNKSCYAVFRVLADTETEAKAFIDAYLDSREWQAQEEEEYEMTSDNCWDQEQAPAREDFYYSADYIEDEGDLEDWPHYKCRAKGSVILIDGGCNG